MVIHFQNPNSVFPEDGEYEEYEEYEENRRDEEGNYIDEEIERSEQSRKRRRKNLRLLLRILAGIGIAAVCAALIAWLASQRIYSSATYEVIATLTPTDDTRYVSLGSHLVYYSKDGASCINHSGSTVWSVSYEMQHPLASKAGNVLALCDYNGSKIYLENADGVIGTVDTSLPIRDISVSESGEVAAVLADTDTTWVYLYESSGNPIAYFKTTMSQSGYPISVAVSPNGELVCVSHLITNSTGIHSSLAFYNFGSVGQNVAENNVAGFNYDDEIFPFVRYLNDSACAAVSDARIAYFNGREIPQNGANAMFTDELQAVYSSDQYIGLLFPDTSGESLYSLQIYDAGGNKVSTIPFDQAFTEIQIEGDAVYINNESSLVIYNLQGQQRFSGSFPMKVSSVIPEGGSAARLYLVTENGMELMTLQ